MPGTFTITKTITAASNDYSLAGAVTVELLSTKISQTWEKKISVQPRPATSGGGSTTKPPQNVARDYKIITHNIKVDGWLDDGTVTVGGAPVTASAVKKKQYLIARASQNRPNSNVVFTWRGETITCQLQKLAFDDEWETVLAGDTDQIDSDLPATQPFGKFKFTLTFLIAQCPGT